MSSKFMNFSPNMLKTFEECQNKFFFKYVEKISIPKSSKPFEKGKKVHALANYFLKGFDINKLERDLSFDEKKSWEVLKQNKYFQMNLFEAEYNLSAKIKSDTNEFWIGGRLDALVFDQGNYYILDYKTGSAPKNPQDDFQTMVYLLCVDKYLKSKRISYNSLKFIYLELKTDTQKEVVFTDELKAKYEEKIISVIEKINFAADSTFYQKNIHMCKNCEYDKICIK